MAHKKRVRLEEKAAASQEDEEIILTPESRQTLIKATRGGKIMEGFFKIIVIKGSVTDEELAVINKKRRNTEMTVADMINLTK